MPIIEIEKESPFKKLSVSDRTGLAAQVSTWYRQFRNKRQTHISTGLELTKYVQLTQPDRNRTKEWKSNIKGSKFW